MSTSPPDPETPASSDARGPTLQQRFEESRLGRRVISGIIVVILGTQVVWSMPDSAIRRGLMPVVEPANAIDVNQRWTMYAPRFVQRIEELEVEVTMADGSARVWKRGPNPWLERIFLPDRWEAMVATQLRQQDGRIEFARWVVARVSGPSDRPVKVTMRLNFKALAPPGQPSKGATGTKVLYEEVLTGKQ